jgi:hypothetical protein
MEQRTERDRRPESGKRKYEPPEILSQEVFETTALACGKKPGGPGACMANSRT